MKVKLFIVCAVPCRILSKHKEKEKYTYRTKKTQDLTIHKTGK